MTEPENPDSLGFLFGGSSESSGSEKQTASSNGQDPIAPAADERPLTRRELRAARDAKPESAALARRVPRSDVAVPAVPVPPPADDLRRAPRSTRDSRPTHDARRRALGTTASGTPKRSWRQRVSATGTMLVVGGIFASLTLPAYAFDSTPEDGELTVVTEGSEQLLAVSADAAGATAARDAYQVISAADIRAQYRSTVREANRAAYLQSGAQALGDDYPWPDQLMRSQGGALSPLRYYYRECVDFVAWRLNRDVGSYAAPFRWDWGNLTPGGGNASQWRNAWASKGWPSGTTPEIGAVAWFPYNHVAYVNSINPDGSVLIEEYNWQSDHMYHQRVIAPGDAYYLYPVAP